MSLDGFGLFVDDMATMIRFYSTEIALYVDNFEEVDKEYEKAISKGAVSVLALETEPWGQRTCYIAEPELVLYERR